MRGWDRADNGSDVATISIHSGLCPASCVHHGTLVDLGDWNIEGLIQSLPDCQHPGHDPG